MTYTEGANQFAESDMHCGEALVVDASFEEGDEVIVGITPPEVETLADIVELIVVADTVLRVGFGAVNEPGSDPEAVIEPIPERIPSAAILDITICAIAWLTESGTT